MQLKARIFNKLPMQSGTSKSGNAWSKATIIVETFGQYPKKVVLSNMKRADEFNQLPLGATATFDIELDSREYNGRWYTEVNCWNWQIDYTHPAPQAPYPPQHQ